MVEDGEGRLVLKLAHWPEADRLAWVQATTAGDLLDEAGLAAGWSEVVRRMRLEAYGRWLGFLASSGRLDPELAPSTRACREHVEAYLAALEPRCAPVTRWAYVSGLAVMLAVLEPSGDNAWLRRLGNRLRARMRPSIDRARLVLPVGEIYAAGLRLMAEALAMPENPPRRPGRRLERETTYRNGLVVAMLAACPLRRRSFSGLEFGRHLVRHSDRFRLQLEPRDLKNASSMTVPLPAALTPWIERYLKEIRPRLMQGYAGPRLWLSRDGTVLSGKSLGQEVNKVTGRLFGRRFGMHLFRHCAATGLARDAPEHAREIPALLGHQGFATGERHYNLAESAVAARSYQNGLASLRRRLREQVGPRRMSEVSALAAERRR